jgi:hypothetical protein
MVLLQRGLKIEKKKNEYLFFNFKTIYMKYENVIINFKTNEVKYIDLKKKIELKKMTK